MLINKFKKVFERKNLSIYCINKVIKKFSKIRFFLLYSVQCAQCSRRWKLDAGLSNSSPPKINNVGGRCTNMYCRSERVKREKTVRLPIRSRKTVRLPFREILGGWERASCFVVKLRRNWYYNNETIKILVDFLKVVCLYPEPELYSEYRSSSGNSK
jgi:hypothetical protein